MSIKRKLGMGVATAALGLSLVGGGTWAAFTDTETLNGSFSNGTLDFAVMELGERTARTEIFHTNLTNMKPGDQITEEFRLKNVGTLAIKEILASMKYDGFVDGIDRTDEFKVKDPGVISQNVVDPVGNKFARMLDVTISGNTANGGPTYTKTLFEWKQISEAIDTDDRHNPLLKDLPVLPHRDNDKVVVTIKLKDEAGNQFQGDSMNLYMHFLGNQYNGNTWNEGDDINDLNRRAQDDSGNVLLPTAP